MEKSWSNGVLECWSNVRLKIWSNGLGFCRDEAFPVIGCKKGVLKSRECFAPTIPNTPILLYSINPFLI
jgi:hypothetical protein